MPVIYGAAAAARMLTKELGQTVLPRHVSDALYQHDSLRDRCPIIGRSRAIPGEVLPELHRILQERAARKAG